MAAAPPIVGLPTGGAGESSRQPSGSKVGESSGDKKYRKLFKHYHKVRAALCASRLHADMLQGDLVATRTTLIVALPEAT